MGTLSRTYTAVLLVASALWCGVPANAFCRSNTDPAKQAEQKQSKETHEHVKRALLVGISIYQAQKADLTPKHQGVVKTETATRQPPSVARGGGRASFSNLDGTIIHTLEDQKATRLAILAAIKKDLVDDACPGDVCVFYYSGHGSRVKNSKGGEVDGYDESLVPADSNQGALDIRDKELALLFLEALKKGVTLTNIVDSRNSGSIGRGYPSEERSRVLRFIETDVAEAPGFNDRPEKAGALLFSASQDFEEAKERRYEGAWRGNFSWALISVLNQPSVSVNEPADQIFQRVTSFMKGEGVSHQPVLAGNQERRKGPLFGRATDKTGGGPTASLVRLRDRVMAELQGGQAMGLSKDSELRKLAADASEEAVRLRVTAVKGLNSSEAMVIEGNAATLKQGDLFVMDRWAAPERADLKVWIPPCVSKSDLARAAQEVAGLRKSTIVDLVDDPTEQTPAYVVEYEEAGWRALLPDGRIQALGLAAGMSKFAAGIPRRSPMFVNLPPSTELRQAIQLGPATSRLSIEITKSPQEANYILVGRKKGNNIEYAWVRPGATKEDKEKGSNPLPTRTDWTIVDDDPAAAAERLSEQAVTLSRIRGWLQIQASTSQSFSYTLALRKSSTDQIIRQGEVQEGVKYDLVLVADEAALKRLQDDNQYVKRQRIYVFSIDSHGDSYLLFNKSGDVENLFPLDPDKPPTQQPKVILLGEREMVTMEPPFGLDTYVLLVSEERIPDPYVLEFKGVVSRGKGSESALAKLLQGIGTASRAPKTNVPLNWSIDRMYLRSVSKPQ